MKDRVLLLERIITSAAVCFAGNTVYKGFADSLELGRADCLLDFGCGLGTVARYAALSNPDGILACGDISPSRLEVCRKRLRRHTHVRYADLGRNPDPFGGETFDVICCHFVLHEIQEPDLPETLSRFFRWLKPGGRVVFREPAGEGGFLRRMDRVLSDAGFMREIARITDLPWIGNAYEGRFIKPLAMAGTPGAVQG